MVTMINSGDTAWMLLCSAMVFLMILGLGFYYGGLVHKKNILSILMQCLTAICLVTLQWVLFGYSLSFGPDHNGWIGSLAWAGLHGVGVEPNLEYCGTVPHLAFMIYQAMLAMLAPVFILGAFAERIKFSAFCLFTLLWSTFVYDPVAHWVWGNGGFLRVGNVLDFAGGISIHMNVGIAALAAMMVLGKREGHPRPMSSPHNMPFAVLGTGILWLGWFGSTTGNALGAGGLAANALVVTQVSAATAGLSWVAIDWILHKHPNISGMLMGLLSGLIAITPAAGFVTLGGAFAIGFGVSILCYVSVALMKNYLQYDDSLDVFSMHGIGGLWGMVATGLWATKTVNANGADGLFYGHPGQLLIQVKAVLATGLYSFGMTWILLKAINNLIGLRVSEASERQGLDLAQHQQSAYTVLD